MMRRDHLRALTRRNILPMLVLLEVALACTVVINTAAMIAARYRVSNAPTGLDERRTLAVHVIDVDSSENALVDLQADLDAIMSVGGVDAATLINQVPFGYTSTTSTIRAEANTEEGYGARIFLGGADVIRTLGLRVLEGRDFDPNMYREIETGASDGKIASEVLITHALSSKLYLGSDSIGRAVYIGEDGPYRIIGVVEQLSGPTISGLNDPNLAVLLPIRPPAESRRTYVARTSHEATPGMVARICQSLSALKPGRTIAYCSTIENMKEKFYERDRSANLLLLSATALIALVSFMGTHALVRFSVQRRTAEIGIRRALGATKGQISAMYWFDSLKLSVGGVALGIVGAAMFNAYLREHFATVSIDFSTTLIVAITFVLLCQLATFVPAYRAATAHPSDAIRRG